MQVKVGDFAIVKGWRRFDVEDVVRVTPKLAFTKGSWSRPNQRKQSELIAVLSDKAAADELAKNLNRALTDHNDRVAIAQAAYDKLSRASRETYDAEIAKLLPERVSA